MWDFATENNDICRERGEKNEKLKKMDLWRSSIKTTQEKKKKSQLIDILIFLEKKPRPLTFLVLACPQCIHYMRNYQCFQVAKTDLISSLPSPLGMKM